MFESFLAVDLGIGVLLRVASRLLVVPRDSLPAIPAVAEMTGV
jgi:hypothetical protein